MKPGVTTADLDLFAANFIRDHGAVPAFLGYQGYPATICASVNEQVVHGIPGPGDWPKATSSAWTWVRC